MSNKVKYSSLTPRHGIGFGGIIERRHFALAPARINYTCFGISNSSPYSFFSLCAFRPSLVALLSAFSSFLEKKGKGGMFTTKWFDQSVISDTRQTIRNTIESLRWDSKQRERARSSSSTTAPAAIAAADTSGKSGGVRGA